VKKFVKRKKMEKNYQGTPQEIEWKKLVSKLMSSWARLRLSNEDEETIKKIASKL